jgi:aminobenzoyl-glutamate utilization protein B
MADRQEKKFALETIERNSEAIALLCDNIFYFAELGMQEFETSGLMKQILEKLGFTIERNPSGMPTKVAPLKECVQSVSANDSGEVSWVVPMELISFSSNIPGLSCHHWSVGVSLATSIAHKGTVAGAKAMAASAIDLFLDPQTVAKAKETFKDEIGDIEYRPLLPPDQKPPLVLNRDLMGRYRPKMREHYLKDKPVFQ